MVNETQEGLKMTTVDTVIINPNILPDPVSVQSVEEINSTDESEIQEEKDKTDTDTGLKNGEGGIRSVARKLFGISLIFLCSLQATTQGAIVKYIEVVPTGQIVMTISFQAICFLGVIAGHSNISLIRFPYKKFVFMRCVIGGLSYVAKNWSYRNLPFGDANALLFTIPFFSGIIARFYLKEKYTLIHVLSTICGLVGIVLVAKPSFLFPSSGSYKEEWHVAVPLIAAAAMGWAYVCVRKAGTAVSPVVVSFYLLVFQFLGGLSYQTVTGTEYVSPSCYEQRGLLLFCSVLAVCMYACLNKGLAIEKSATGSLVRNCDTVLAYLVQIFVFRADVDALSLVGAGLIVVGTVFITLGTAFDWTCGVQF